MPALSPSQMPQSERHLVRQVPVDAGLTDISIPVDPITGTYIGVVHPARLTLLPSSLAACSHPF